MKQLMIWLMAAVVLAAFPLLSLTSCVEWFGESPGPPFPDRQIQVINRSGDSIYVGATFFMPLQYPPDTYDRLSCQTVNDSTIVITVPGSSYDTYKKYSRDGNLYILIATDSMSVREYMHTENDTLLLKKIKIPTDSLRWLEKRSIMPRVYYP